VSRQVQGKGEILFSPRRIGLLTGFILVLGTAASLAQTELTTGPFTASQAEDGRKAYMARCASCHKANLQGQGEVPPLAGRTFMAGWSTRTSQDLYNLIHASMPPGAADSLDDQTYANLTAFILHANGAMAGPTSFLRAPPLRIGLIANGFAPGDLDLNAPPAAPAGVR
jgi:cytochrome c553